MKYLSVCDGIGAAHVAWPGWNCVGASEIERFPIEVVKHNRPEIPHLGDMTKYHEWNIEQPDLVCGGTPCQSFSIAGLRDGMADPRGNLALVFLGIIDHFRPRWVVWENVPGVYSSTSHESPDPQLENSDLEEGAERIEVDSYGADEEHAFASFVAGLEELGYGVVYRTLDAQYFGVPQRRRRVFVVAYLGDWRPATAVLLERESLRGDPAPSRQAGEGIAPTISARSKGGGGLGTDAECDGALIACDTADTLTVGANQTTGFIGDVVAFDPAQITSVTNRSNPHPGDPCHTLHQNEPPIIVRMREGKDGGGKGPMVSDQSFTLATANDQILAFAQNTRDEVRLQGGDGGVIGSLSAQPGMKQTTFLATSMQVRRLTPMECERLQGFPDRYTEIPWNKKPAEDCPDGPRYKALGNSWPVPVVRWIGGRIDKVEQILKNLGR